MRSSIMQIISKVKVLSCLWLIEGTEVLKLALTMTCHCTHIKPGSARQQSQPEVRITRGQPGSQIKALVYRGTHHSP